MLTILVSKGFKDLSWFHKIGSLSGSGFDPSFRFSF